MATNPNIIANSNWNSIAIKRSTFGLETMTSCINSHIRPNQTVIADVYFCNVEHRTIIISMEIVTYMDVLTKVTMKIIADKGTDTHIAKQLFHDILFLGKFSQSETV